MSQPSSEQQAQANSISNTQLPDRFQARVVGKVEHRVGDGPLEAIPVGQELDVVVAMASMVLSWKQEGQPVTVTLAREEFLHYVDEGQIRILR